MKTVKEYAAMVEAALPETLGSLGTVPESLLEAMSYSLCAGGKRLRPVLLLAVVDALGGDVQHALPFACALEMIHTYSLIHDDLPAMDDDDLRRGRPTNHKMFGEDMAILAGDGLLHGAFEVMLRAASTMDDLRGTRAAEAIARRSGVTGMVAGQVVDVQSSKEQTDENRLRYIHAHKTADLLTAPLEAGLYLAGATSAQLAAGMAYGYHLGMGFQMVDDLLDVVGDAATLGKQTGMDAAHDKLTWIALRGLEGTRADARKEIEAAVAAAADMVPEPVFFQELAWQTLSRVN